MIHFTIKHVIIKVKYCDSLCLKSQEQHGRPLTSSYRPSSSSLLHMKQPAGKLDLASSNLLDPEAHLSQ